MTNESFGLSGNKPHDFLVVHDLGSPPGQAEEFAEAIRKAAHVVHDWQEVVVIPETRFNEWSVDKLRGELGISNATTLYLNLFPTNGSRLMSAAFRTGQIVGFGDGIGVNFSATYFSPELGQRAPTLLSRAVRSLARGRPRQAIGHPFAGGRFDELHLLLPGLFDEPAPPHVRIQSDRMRALFARLAAAPSLGLAAFAEQLRPTIAASDRTLFLLTSNFSENGRMTLSAEVGGYLEMVRRAGPTPRTLVVIKPHPRDATPKLEAVTEAIERECRVVSLAATSAAYLPFEAIVSFLLDGEPEIRSKLTALCVSTACLSLEYLYGIHCEIGFGEPECLGFTRPWRRHRVRHERDLRQALGRIRAGEFGDVPR